MNEAETRAELIDPKLEAAGWKSGSDVRVFREYPIKPGEIRASGMRTGALVADYVLSFRGILLAAIEAKSRRLDVAEGVSQAKLYAQKLRLETSFATNGKAIYQICHVTGTEGPIKSFPTPLELWNKTYGDASRWLVRFGNVPFEDMNGTKKPRYYQTLAVNRAMQAIADKKHRILLTLATGTGKTFIAFQIAWKLFQSRWTIQRDEKRTPRILFLADRNILADQAWLGFGAFNEDALVRIRPEEISKRGEVPKNGSVFFAIFQTFMSGADSHKHYKAYESDFFDLVIIDECHRGGANDESTWRGILEHFSGAVHLGLTATPKRTDNADTYHYFGEPVFTYSLKEGIQDGFLTPFRVKRIQTTIDEYLYTPEDEILEGEVEEGHVYTESDFNKRIVIEERERKRVQDMLAAINQAEKTLVFCANQAHAGLVRDLINQEADRKSVDYCVRVAANDGAMGNTYLKQFQDNDKSIPTILTTSQKLTTGVDARNVRNIVLVRPVNSMIEFKQIIGRGTRLFEGKYFFTIIDFVNAYHLFNDTEWDGEPVKLEGDNTGEKDEESISSGGDSDGGGEDTPARGKIRVKLSDGKVRELQSMSSTYFYVDGKPVSAKEYLKHLFDTVRLPALLGSEAALREAWSNPLTRKDLLEKLAHEGCHKEDLCKLQTLTDAEDSDLFDVLEYIAYLKPTITRAARAEAGKRNIHNFLNEAQREFVCFVLRNYVKEGVDELDPSKLSTILIAKYGDLPAAKQQLGEEEQIRRTFIDFQKYLYSEDAA